MTAPPDAKATELPKITLVDLLLLGAPEGKTELIDGRVFRVVRANSRSEAEGLFLRLAREVCERQGIPWCAELCADGCTSFDRGRLHLSVDEEWVRLEVDVSREVWSAFEET